MGAVAYDPKVVTIWDGFRRWFAEHDLAFDYVLYSNYERQVEDLRRPGASTSAWNSPLAWVRTPRLVPRGRGPSPCATPTGTSPRSSWSGPTRGLDEPADLAGRVVGTGAVDSPQATLLPLALLDGVEVTVRRFDVGVGLHGDHIGGERDAARALVAGEVDAACMIDGNHLLFAREGTLPAGATRSDRPDPALRPLQHDGRRSTAHCSSGSSSLLLGMDYADPAVRPLLDLEGLTRWLPGRHDGLRAARGGRRPARLLRRRGRGHRRWLPTLRLDLGPASALEPAAVTCWSTGPWPDCRPATRLRVVGRDPHLGRPPGPPGPARGPPGRRANVVVQGDAGDRRMAGAERAGAPRPWSRPSRRRQLGVGGARGAGRGGGPPLVVRRSRRRRRGVDRPRPQALRAGRGRPVGPGHGHRLDAAATCPTRSRTPSSR